ncbi:hypothetical protein C0J52_02489 [Blattella germanica]|nr:hypothetical protein C0J52_02489 [Blattella germanica]
MRKDFKPRISACGKNNGEITNDTNEILDTWKEHFKELLDGEDQVLNFGEKVAKKDGPLLITNADAISLSYASGFIKVHGKRYGKAALSLFKWYSSPQSFIAIDAFQMSYEDSVGVVRITSRSGMPIESIKEIRAGKNTEVLRSRELSGAHTEDCAFSILYGDEFESLDLVASTPEEANIWITGLNALIGAHKVEINYRSKNNDIHQVNNEANKNIRLCSRGQSNTACLDMKSSCEITNLLHNTADLCYVDSFVTTMRNDQKSKMTIYFVEEEYFIKTLVRINALI